MSSEFILVTGGTGGIGSFITRLLAHRGEKVLAYDIAPRQIDFADRLSEKVKVVRGDILDLPYLLHTAKKFGVKGLVSTAAVVGDLATRERPYMSFKVNVEGTVNLLEAARLLDLEKVVYFSTSSVYGPCEGKPLDECLPTKQVDIYTTTKIMSETVGLGYAEVYGIEFASIRPSMVYGVGQVYENPISIILKKALANEPVRTSCGIEQPLDPVYVKDVANGAILAYYAKRTEHRVFNIGSGAIHGLSEFAGIVRHLLPNASIEIGPGMLDTEEFLPTWHPQQTYLSNLAIRGCLEIGRARRELKYEPKYTLERGVKEYLEFLKRISADP